MVRPPNVYKYYHDAIRRNGWFVIILIILLYSQVSVDITRPSHVEKSRISQQNFILYTYTCIFHIQIYIASNLVKIFNINSMYLIRVFTECTHMLYDINWRWETNGFIEILLEFNETITSSNHDLKLVYPIKNVTKFKPKWAKYVV